MSSQTLPLRTSASSQPPVADPSSPTSGTRCGREPVARHRLVRHVGTGVAVQRVAAPRQEVVADRDVLGSRTAFVLIRIPEVCEHGTRIVLWRMRMSFPPSDWNPSKCSVPPQNAGGVGPPVVVGIRPAHAERVLDRRPRTRSARSPSRCGRTHAVRCTRRTRSPSSRDARSCRSRRPRRAARRVSFCHPSARMPYEVSVVTSLTLRIVTFGAVTVIDPVTSLFSYTCPGVDSVTFPH